MSVLFTVIAHKTAKAAVLILICVLLLLNKKKDNEVRKGDSYHIFILLVAFLGTSSILICVTSWPLTAPRQLEICNLKAPSSLPHLSPPPFWG